MLRPAEREATMTINHDASRASGRRALPSANALSRRSFLRAGAPDVEVHIVQNSEPPGGLGEAGTSAIVPAVANAIFAATGKRLRKLPVDAMALKRAT
jgi:hypothetical protein